MRKFRNLPKKENNQLSEKFSFLLKYNEDCTEEDFSWAAITIFDHWLYETDSFNIIDEATNEQKLEWNKRIKTFLSKLCDIEQPIRYKYVGRNTKQRLQFSRYVESPKVGEYVSNLFDDVYCPNIVFYALGVDLWFEDNWTIHFKYKKQEDCLKMFSLAAEMNLFVLPAYSADHLNKYSVLSKYLSEQNLNKLLKQDS
ncbi:hypothetical protein [Shewanella sp. Koi 1]